LPCKEPSAGLSALTRACKMGREAAMVVAHNQGQLAFVLVSHGERPAASCNQAGSRDHMHVHRAVKLRGDQGLQVTSGNKHDRQLMFTARITFDIAPRLASTPTQLQGGSVRPLHREALHIHCLTANGTADILSCRPV
jgi:hypothetical protein